jgi:ABC-2 type transport system permease protein
MVARHTVEDVSDPRSREIRPGKDLSRVRAGWPSDARFVAQYVRANFEVALAYRGAFLSKVFAFIVSDAMWVAFWWLYFERFQSLEGYGFRQIVLVWAIGATSFGLLTGVTGGATKLASRIASGELDFYLLLPKSPLLHLVVSQMDPGGVGDALFGVVTFAVLARPSISEALAFCVVVGIATAVIVAYVVAVQSLAFWTGRAETIADQALFGLITFSTYPERLFGGPVKIVLFTLIPAGFVSYVPVRLVQEWDWTLAGALLGVAVGAVFFSATVFRVGLRRYQSGSMLAMRG